MNLPASALRKLKAPVSDLAVAEEVNLNMKLLSIWVTIPTLKTTYKEEGEIKVGQRCPCKHELNCVVEEFNL